MQLLPDNRHFNIIILSKVGFPYNREYIVFSQDLIFLSGVLSDANIKHLPANHFSTCCFENTMIGF